MRYLLLAGILMLSLACSAGPAAAASGCIAESYDITPLPLIPLAVNESAQVAGTTRNHRAALWDSHDGLRVLELPAGFDEAQASAINARGTAVGTVRNRATQASRAFYFRGGRLTLLPGESSAAMAISDDGKIVGMTVAETGRMAPVIWENDEAAFLENCCGGSALAINEKGEIVGNLYDKEGRYRAAMWTSRAAPPSFPVADAFSAAFALAADGTILIRAANNVFLSGGGGESRIGVPRARRLKPHAMNSCHVVVGAFGPYSDANRAFVWHGGNDLIDLNSLIPRLPGRTLEGATAINDRGIIVGTGDFKGESDAGYLLSPRR